jgi:catechol 2,3-dioxygenase-like lactoylglutathione lyase family enzyme
LRRTGPMFEVDWRFELRGYLPDELHRFEIRDQLVFRQLTITAKEILNLKTATVLLDKWFRSNEFEPASPGGGDRYLRFLRKDQFQHSILVRDFTESLDFYTRTLGLPLTTIWGEQNAGFYLGHGVSLKLTSASGPFTERTASPIQIRLSAGDSLAEAADELRQRGVEFLGSIREEEGAQVLNLRAPEGSEIRLAASH